jgi:FkbM family methyltransferase
MPNPMSIIRSLRFYINHPLNKSRKSRTVLNYLKWQVGSRLVPGAVVFDWVAGTKAIIRPGDLGMTINIYCGLHEFEDMAYLLDVMTPDDMFVDVGANVGSYTILACGARGARGYCFEPVPATFKRLRENLDINHLGSRVTALNIGVADSDGELNFTSKNGPENRVVRNQDTSGDAITVPVRTLDSVISQEAVTFLKIDVEGFETAVLKGASSVLSSPSLHSVLIELNGLGAQYGFEEDRIIERMTGFGFSMYAFEPRTRQLRRLDIKNTASSNTLFLRNESEIMKRIANAPRITAPTFEL